MFLLKELPDEKVLKEFKKQFPEMNVSATAACLTLLKVASTILAELERHFASHEISQARFLALIVLRRTETGILSQVEIARQMGISKKNTCRLIESLESDKLVKRSSQKDDARVTLMSLTPKGLKVLEEVLPGYYKIINQYMEALTSAQVSELSQTLSKIPARFSQTGDTDEI